MAKLSKKHELFVREYLTDLNQTRAYIAAGYSKQGAAQSASKLLKNPKIQAEVAKRTEKRLDKLDVTADYVLQNIKDIGEHCMQKKWPKMVRQGREMVQVEEEVINPETGEEELAQVFEFNALGALKAQELLGKYLKLFTDKVEHGGGMQMIVRHSIPQPAR